MCVEVAMSIQNHATATQVTPAKPQVTPRKLTPSKLNGLTAEDNKHDSFHTQSKEETASDSLVLASALTSEATSPLYSLVTNKDRMISAQKSKIKAKYSDVRAWDVNCSYCLSQPKKRTTQTRVQTRDSRSSGSARFTSTTDEYKFEHLAHRKDYIEHYHLKHSYLSALARGVRGHARSKTTLLPKRQPQQAAPPPPQPDNIALLYKYKLTADARTELISSFYRQQIEDSKTKQTPSHVVAAPQRSPGTSLQGTEVSRATSVPLRLNRLTAPQPSSAPSSRQTDEGDHVNMRRTNSHHLGEKRADTLSQIAAMGKQMWFDSNGRAYVSLASRFDPVKGRSLTK